MYNIIRYNRITDGCSSQYWCYGSFHHLETMPTDLNIPNIQILEEVDDDTDLDDLVFENELNAFGWLKMCMDKCDEDSFSKSFKQIELFCIPKEEVPANVVCLCITLMTMTMTEIRKMRWRRFVWLMPGQKRFTLARSLDNPKRILR